MIVRFCFVVPIVWLCVAVGSVTVAGLAAAPPAFLESEFTHDEFHLKLKFDQEPTYRVWRNHTPAKVIIDVESSGPDDLPAMIEFNDAAVQRVRTDVGPLGLRVVIDLAFSGPVPITQYDGTSLVVRIPIRFQNVDETFVRPGVRYGSVRMGQDHGPVSAKYIKVDLNHPEVYVDVALSDGRFGLIPIRTLALQLGAFAGINGSFFHWTGRPLGLFVHNGKLISEDVFARAALTVGTDGSVKIARQSVEMELALHNETVRVDGINRPRQSGEVVVYTFEYGRLQNPGGQQIVVRPPGVVTNVHTDDLTAIGNEAFIVEFDAAAPILQEVLSGDSVTFTFRLVPGHDVDLRLALGGGPLLMADGKIHISGIEEQFKPDVLLGRAPRTALGLTENDELLLVVVDGRRPGVSNGMSLQELAELMQTLGAVSAMNLDGGGSSTLVLRDRVLNEPSTGEERPVSNGLFIFIRDEN